MKATQPIKKEVSVTQQIREELGLTQKDLAMYLLIPLSQLAMYETRKRELPAATSIKLAELITFLNQSQKNSKGKNELLNTQKEIVNKQLQSQTIELEYQLIKAQRKYEAMQKKLDQSIKLKALANLLSEKKKQPNELFLLQSKRGIEQNNLAIQTKQLIKIEGIKSQLQFVKRNLETKSDSQI
jgi:transcriptional regulator with XRE-family HTH domain